MQQIGQIGRNKVLSAIIDPWRGWTPSYDFDGDLNAVMYPVWGFVTEGKVRNGPTGFGIGTYMVIPIMHQYWTQVVFGTNKIYSRHYLYGSWSAWVQKKVG